KGDWDRPSQKSLLDLSSAQEALSGEVRGLIEKQFKDDKVITHAVGDAADAMTEVEEAIKQMREDGFLFEQLDEDKSTVQSPQKSRRDKLRRTQADLAALVDEMSQPGGDPEPPPGPEQRGKPGATQKDKAEGKN